MWSFGGAAATCLEDGSRSCQALHQQGTPWWNWPRPPKGTCRGRNLILVGCIGWSPRAAGSGGGVGGHWGSGKGRWGPGIACEWLRLVLSWKERLNIGPSGGACPSALTVVQATVWLSGLVAAGVVGQSPPNICGLAVLQLFALQHGTGHCHSMFTVTVELDSSLLVGCRGRESRER